MRSFYRLLLSLAQGQTPFALAIITGVKGSSPQKAGAKAAFLADGRMIGTVGGGCLEAEIQDRARGALLRGQPMAFDLALDGLAGWDDNLVCGGSVSVVILPNGMAGIEIWRQLAGSKESMAWGIRDNYALDWVNDPTTGWRYQETADPPSHLWIAGAGHIAQAVTPLAQKVDFEVTVFDDRPALANLDHFPPETTLRVDCWDKLLQDTMPSGPVYGLIVTRGHQHDASVLRAWIHRPMVYLGMIGSQRKARLVRAELESKKYIDTSDWGRIHCPVGLKIHARTVNEIAISIVAQLIEKRAEMKHEQ